MELIEPVYYHTFHVTMESPQSSNEMIRVIQECFVKWGIQIECKRQRKAYVPPSIETILTPGQIVRVYSSNVKTVEQSLPNGRTVITEFFNVRDRDNTIGDKRMWRTVLCCTCIKQTLNISVYREFAIPGTHIDQSFPVDYLEEPACIHDIKTLLGIEREYEWRICDTQATVDACERELSTPNPASCKIVLTLDKITPDVIAYWHEIIPDAFETYLVSQTYMTSNFWHEVPFRHFVCFTPCPRKSNVLYGRGFPLKDIEGIRAHLSKLMHLMLAYRLRKFSNGKYPWQCLTRNDSDFRNLRRHLEEQGKALAQTQEDCRVYRELLDEADTTQQATQQKLTTLQQAYEETRQQLDEAQRKTAKYVSLEVEAIDPSAKLYVSADLRTFLCAPGLWPNLIISENAKKKLEDYAKINGRDKNKYTPVVIYHAFMLLNFVLYFYYAKGDSITQPNVSKQVQRLVSKQIPPDALEGNLQQIDMEIEFAILAQKYTGETNLKFAKTEDAKTKNDIYSQRERKFIHKGKEYYAWPHIKYGRDFRIYFCYLSEEHKLYIHHCGGHLRTCRSKKDGERR